MKNSTAAVTRPSRNTFGKGGSKPARPGGMSAPKNVHYRVHPAVHKFAPKARTTKSAVPIFPRPARDVATFGNPR